MNCENIHNTKAIYFSEGQKKQNTNGTQPLLTPLSAVPCVGVGGMRFFLPSSWVYLFTFAWGMTMHTN